MLGKRQQLKFLDALGKSVQGRLNTWQHGRNNKKAIHDMRLALKHIHTLSGLNRPEGDKHYASHIHPLCRKLGKIRDLQVAMDHLDSFGASVDLKHPVKAELRSNLKKVEEKLPQFRKRLDKGLRRIADSLVQVDVKPIVDQLYAKLKKKSSGKPGRSTMHEIRKYSQHLLHILEWTDLDSKVPKLASKSKLRKLQKELGAWHDIYLLSVHLKKNNFHKKQLYKKISDMETAKLKDLRVRVSKTF